MRHRCALLMLVVLSCSTTVLAASLEAFEGRYPLTESLDAHLRRQSDGWTLQLGKQPEQRLQPGQEPDTWQAPALGITLVVRGDDLRIVRYGVDVSLKNGAEELRKAKAAASPAEALDRLTPRCMIALNVPGVSIAVVRDRKLAWQKAYGVKQHDRPDKVKPDTVFEAASMSKPVFAYVVMRLAQEGKLDLDAPLVKILGEPYAATNDPRHERMTARMALSHTTGFPNWRPGGISTTNPVPVQFEPGTKLQYSGEGFLFLQRAVEKLTGEPADALMQRRLLAPLAMAHSSYVWQERFTDLAAAGHTAEGVLPERKRPLYRKPNVAYTLYTTPSDYAQVLIEMMRADRSAAHSLDKATLAAMLTPTPSYEGRKPVQRRGDEGDATVHFGLGWRLDRLPSGNRYYHSGSNGTGFRSYCEFNPQTGNGIVIMTNSAAGSALWTEVMEVAGE